MTSIDTILNTTAVQHSGIPIGSPLSAALRERSDVLLMTQQAEEAVLKPADAGCWPHALRAALAARTATHNKQPSLASHYAQLIEDDKYHCIADASNNGSEMNLEHVVTYMDSVATRPRDISITDIKTLQDHGVSDADIVRLTELNAFMAYQIRLITGLKLMAGNTAFELPA